MQKEMGVIYDDVKKCVDDIIAYVGKDITFAMPLALGKPVKLVNELYRRAKADPTMRLRILTALPLEIPKGKSEIEKRFYKDLIPRLFEGVPEFEYMLDYRAGKLPPNVEFFEFFSLAGTYVGDPYAQQRHLASNYTHVVRDAWDFGLNVFGNLIGYKEIDGKMFYSMGCNADICIEGLERVQDARAKGQKILIVGEANKNMPFMYGDSVTEPDAYDMILQGPDFDYELFGVPKDPVSDADYMIGVNVSPLVKDGGTIQVGIGSLGDAIVAGLVLRNDHNEIYQQVLEKAGILKRYGNLINKLGGVTPFKEGLYGASEMFVDAFKQLYTSGILKRQVFDSIPIMKLINEGYLRPDKIPADILDRLLEMKAIQPVMTEEDFNFLTEFGILREGLKYENGFITDGSIQYSTDLSNENNRKALRQVLGNKLRNGHVCIGAFFLGPKGFYKWLREMPEEERKLFAMAGVEKVNQLYGDEELRRLQRKDARFINTGLVATLFGAVASDQLENGQVISGIGGQYNFVAMGHALPDARVIICIRATRGQGKALESNIVWTYGHCSIPKHLRDIVVTEYGIADLRGKPEWVVMTEMIKIADSRFQEQLLEQAKKAGKVPADWEIPAEYRNNYPERIAEILKPFKARGFFPKFPFGTDLSQDDIDLSEALKNLQAQLKGYRGKVIRGLLAELFKPIPEAANRHLKRMDLLEPKTTKEKLLRKIIVYALRNNGYFDKSYAYLGGTTGATPEIQL